MSLDVKSYIYSDFNEKTFGDLMIMFLILLSGSRVSHSYYCNFVLYQKASMDGT